MEVYQSTDFVQIEHWQTLQGGEPFKFWRNALYVTQEGKKHIVIYTDGTKEVLFGSKKIRRPEKFKKPRKHIVGFNHWEKFDGR